MKLSKIKRNSQAIEDGEWVSEIPELGDIEFKVRGSQNEDARRLRDRLLNALPREQRQGNVDPKAIDAIMAKVAAETIILDWRNIADEDGNNVPFSKETALEYFTDPDFSLLLAGVQWASDRVGQNVTTDNEADAKN